MKNKFRFILSLICLLLVGCDETETRTYDDYLDNYITLDDFYHENERYGVYLFGKYCSYCNKIKTKVFNYADSIYKGDSHNLENFYFFEFQSYNTEEGKEQRARFKEKPSDYSSYDEKQREQLIEELLQSKPTKLSETYFLSTPSIYVIEDGVLVDIIRGSNKIPNWLSTH